MAPLSPDNTARVYYTYSNGINEHTMVLRIGVSDDFHDADTLMENLLSAIGGKFHASTFTVVEESAAGSNIRFPVASDRLGDLFGSGAATKDTDAQAATFVGKSSGGRLARLSIFGYKDVISAYRLTAGEDAAVASAIEVLNVADTAGKAIDGLDVLWKGYIDIKPNDHWVTESR